MAININEQKFLLSEMHRVLKSGAFCIYSARDSTDPHFRKGIHRGDNMYEVDGFVVNFIDDERISSLSTGFEIIDIARFEEGFLPRRLSLAIMRKNTKP